MNMKIVLLACFALILLSGSAFAINVLGCNSVLASSGYYTLFQSINASNVTSPLASSGTGCINITGTNIVLDLGGWRIENSSLSIGYGIVVFANTSNITIMNGTLQNLTGANGGAIYFAAPAGSYMFNATVENITVANATTAVITGANAANITVRSLTSRNVTHGIYLNAGTVNFSVINSNLTNSSNAMVVFGNFVSGVTRNISVQNTELSFSRVGFNTTQESAGDLTPSVFNVTLIGVRFLNNSLFDYYGNSSNETHFNFVMFNNTNISANFSNYAGFKSSSPVSTDAPLAYNLSYFVNITNISSIAGNSPQIDLTFHYLSSDVPAAADASSLSIYVHTTSWSAVSSSVNTNTNTVTATAITSFRSVDNQYGLFLSATPAPASSSDSDSRRSIQKSLDPIPVEYSCQDGHFVVKTLPNARVHVSQVCDPACARADGGLACSFDVNEQSADSGGYATFGGNGYYYVNILQTASPDYREEANYETCFASCGAPLHSFASEQTWSCSPEGLRVTVRDENGNLVNNAFVELATDPVCPAGAQCIARRGPGITKETSNGFVDFTSVPEGSNRLYISKDGFESDSFAVVDSPCAPKELSYKLELLCPQNRVRVTVMDKATGDVIEGANIVYSVMPGVSDANGQAEFVPEANEQNRYLYVSKDGYPLAVSVSVSNQEQGTCTPATDDSKKNPNGTDQAGTGDGSGDNSLAKDCTDLQISVDRSNGFVGEQARALVRCGSVPLANKEIIIVPPQGPSRRVTTDATGAISLPLEFQGTYQVGVVKGEEIVDRESIQVGLKPSTDPSKKGLFAFLGEDPVRASLLVLIIGVALIGAYLYLRSTKNGKSKKLTK